MYYKKVVRRLLGDGTLCDMVRCVMVSVSSETPSNRQYFHLRERTRLQ